MWYVIATNASPPEAGDSWLEQLNLEDHHLDDDLHMYWQGFFWSMATMIGLASPVYPTRGIEVVFLSGHLLCSFLFASTLVSSFSAMLMDIQMQNQELTDRMRTLKF